MLTAADQTALRGGRFPAGKQHSLQQTSQDSQIHTDSHDMPSTSNQHSGDLTAVQVKDAAHHAETGYPESEIRNDTTAGNLALEPCLKGIEFVENLKNPSNLQPVALPLQLKLFSRIPVVVSARLFGQTGMPSDTFARFLIRQ